MIRIKVQSMRSLLWLGNFLVFAGIALLLVQIFVASRSKGKLLASMPQEKIDDQLKGDASIQKSARGQQMDWKQFHNLWELNVTGKEPPPPPDPTKDAEAAVPTLTPIENCVAVDLVQYAKNQQLAWAQLRYLEPDMDPALTSPTTTPEIFYDPGSARIALDWYQPGAALRGKYAGSPFSAKIVEILESGVKFSWGGEEKLVPMRMVKDTLEGVPGAVQTLPGLDGKPTGGGTLAPSMSAEEKKETRQLGENSWFIGTDELERVEREHDAMLDEIKIKSEYSARDKRTYIKLTKVPEGSLAKQRGFLEDDVLRRINGEEITSKMFVVNFVKEHPGVSTFTLELERRGTRITKSFQIAR